MKMKLRLTAFSILMFLSALSVSAEDYTLIIDQYWNSMLEKELNDNPLGRFKKAVTDAVPFFKRSSVKIEGKSIGIVEIQLTGGPDDSRIVLDAAGQAGDRIILSPMLAVYACDAATAFSGKHFSVPCVSIPAECGAANLAYYEFDYSDAFAEAGRWAAALKQDSDVLFYTGESGRKVMLEAFKSGRDEGAEGSGPAITEITDLKMIDSDFIDNYTAEKLQEDGVSFLFAGPATTELLSRFDGNGRRLAIMHAHLWADSGYNCAASIELSPVSVLTQIINNDSIDIYDNPVKLKAEFFLYEEG